MNTFTFKTPSKKYTKKEKDIIRSANRDIFEIHNMDLSIVNSIRRVILSEIPTIGFLGEKEPTINIIKNNGPLHNEFMIHRIGNIPIHFSEEEVESFIEDEYEFYMDIKNNDKTNLNITTKYIKGRKNGNELNEKTLGRLFPPNNITKNHILITRLRHGEELAFNATVIKSNTLNHASFSPVSLCAFSFIQDEEKNKEEKDILQKERNYLKNEYGDPTAIEFSIEPEKGLSTKYLFAKAIEILRNKLDIIEKELETTNSTKVILEKNEDIDNTYDLHINNETDTFGNLFQSINYSKYIREKNSILDGKFNMNYIGYYAPHPFDAKIVIRLTLTNKDNIKPTSEEALRVYKKCLLNVDQILKEVYDEWIRFE